MITFNNGSADFHPVADIVEGYEGASDVATVAHPILNGSPAYTLRTADPIAAAFRVLMGTLAAAKAFHTALLAPVVWSFTDTDNLSISTDLVVFGDSVKLQLDRDTRDDWWVEFSYREVS